VLAAWPVASASAADPVLDQKLVSPNFVVHYTTVAGSPDSITAGTAQVVAGNAERALAAEEAQFGFDPPLAGPDGHIDIYVYAFRAATADGIVGPRSPDADQSESYILLPANNASDLAVIAHEMFHVLQNSVWVSAGKFLDEATAVWAQVRAFPGGYSTDFDPSTPLDCVDEKVCQSAGYQSWSFFEFLAERYGPRIVREIYEQAKALRVNRGGAPTAALAAAIAPHGGTLATAFRDFALANINGDYTLDELEDAGLAGLTDTTPLRTGVKTAKLPVRSFKVDHLATTYVPVRAGGGKRKGACRKARLSIDVSGPKVDGVAGYALGEVKPRPIALVSGRGRLTLGSWSTCSSAELILALINGGTSGDGRTFRVSATLIVR